MNLGDAIVAMLQGKKVRLTYWVPETYIYLKDGEVWCHLHHPIREYSYHSSLKTFAVSFRDYINFEEYVPLKTFDFTTAIKHLLDGKKVGQIDSPKYEQIGDNYYYYDKAADCIRCTTDNEVCRWDMHSMSVKDYFLVD